MAAVEAGCAIGLDVEGTGNAVALLAFGKGVAVACVYLPTVREFVVKAGEEFAAPRADVVPLGRSIVARSERGEAVACRVVTVVGIKAVHGAACAVRLVMLQAEGQGGFRGEVVFEDAVEGTAMLFGAMLPFAAVVVYGYGAPA